MTITEAQRVWLGRAILVACLVAAAVFFGRGRWLVAAGFFGLALLQAALLLPRGRRGYFAVATVVISTALTLAAVFGLDLYLHRRFADNGGYNVWGYRGEAVGRKRAPERRLAMLGGSVGFGFGVRANETIPFLLQQRLNAAGGTPTTVINLGWNSEGAYALLPTLQDYAYLDYDGAILYSGYNDLSRNTQVFRHESAVFRLTGYLPILPIIPIRQWLRVDKLSDTTSENGKVVFRPNLADRYAAEAADTALRVSQALEHELRRLSPADTPPAAPRNADEDDEWADYCASVERATRYLVDRGRHAFVVTEPFVDARHIRQQLAVWQMLKAKFPGDPHVHYIDMGGALDLDDRALCYDGLHLTAAGNARLAGRLAPAIQAALERRDSHG